MVEELPQRLPQPLQVIDSSILRAHQHALGEKKGARITPLAVLVADRAPRSTPFLIRRAFRCACTLRQARLRTRRPPTRPGQRSVQGRATPPTRRPRPFCSMRCRPALWWLTEATIALPWSSGSPPEARHGAFPDAKPRPFATERRARPLPQRTLVERFFASSGSSAASQPVSTGARQTSSPLLPSPRHEYGCDRLSPRFRRAVPD